MGACSLSSPGRLVGYVCPSVERLNMKHRHADQSEYRTFASVKLVEIWSRISLTPSRHLFLGQPVGQVPEGGSMSEFIGVKVYKGCSASLHGLQSVGGLLVLNEIIILLVEVSEKRSKSRKWGIKNSLRRWCGSGWSPSAFLPKYAMETVHDHV